MSKYLLILSCLCFALSLIFYQPFFKQKKQDIFYFSPSKHIKYFSFGFPDLLADILWMRLLQNIDFCSSKKGLPVYDGTKRYHCVEGWSYKMTHAITELSPRFSSPYKLAGPILSVIQGDKIGAKKIFDKAIKVFPEDWRLHFSASYHYLVELEKEEEAIPLMIKTADLGGPSWLYVLATKTYLKQGKWLLAKELIGELMKKETLSEQQKETLKNRLKKIQQEMSSKNSL